LDIISNPIDLETVQKKIDASVYKERREADEKFYLNLDEFKKDISLIFENARIYN